MEELKYCPLLLMAALASGKRNEVAKCKGKDCAWWETYYPGESLEYSQCAVNAISCLKDTA